MSRWYKWQMANGKWPGLIHHGIHGCYSWRLLIPTIFYYKNFTSFLLIVNLPNLTFQTWLRNKIIIHPKLYGQNCHTIKVAWDMRYPVVFNPTRLFLMGACTTHIVCAPSKSGLSNTWHREEPTYHIVKVTWKKIKNKKC